MEVNQAGILNQPRVFLNTSMSKISKTKISAGVFWLEVPEAELFVLCGCPADSVKHLMKAGKIHDYEIETDSGSGPNHHSHGTITNETGPNAILLSDLSVQKGDFANLAEFPVLQMLYRQGMLLPNHPNNTGAKPLLIGQEHVVNAQMNYIYRGNYGLTSLEDILASGLPREQAEEMMRIKLFFAFGEIRPSSDLLQSIIVDHEPVEVLNGVKIVRKKVNCYEFIYKDESVEVDLNLAKNETYETPYQLENHYFKRDYFSVVHTGEGDGWDIDRPCMASVICFQGKIFLIDVGPNIAHTLNAIGIDVNEVEGIFHTHAHDDHFAGLTTLIHTNHKIKYYSTQMVRASVTKKLSSLMSIEESTFEEYFEVCDLEFDEWNNIDGLEVKPVYSPHPVETNILFFRTLWEDGYATYAHLADVASHDILNKMLQNNKKKPGISSKLKNKVWNDYLSPVQVKKIDIGGGIIHGKAEDFKDDKSEKIILAHTAHKLSEEEQLIGCGVTFGSTDVLIEGHEDYPLEFGGAYLQGYYPNVEDGEIHMLLNCKRELVSPGTVLLKDQEIPDHACLVLTGVAEFLSAEEKTSYQLSSGTLIGDLAVLFGLKSTGIYRALSHIETLRIPEILFKEFVHRNELTEQLKKTHEITEFLQQTWLFGESISSPVQSQIAQNMTLNNYSKGEKIVYDGLMLVKEGKVELSGLQSGRSSNKHVISKGDFWGGENMITSKTSKNLAKAVTRAKVYSITNTEIFKQIPIIRWKLLEQSQKRV